MNRLMVLCGVPALEKGILEALKTLCLPEQFEQIVCTGESGWKEEAKKAGAVLLCSFMENDPAAAAAFAYCQSLNKPVLYAEGAGLPVLLRLVRMRDEVDTLAELKDSLEGGRPYGLTFSLFEK